MVAIPTLAINILSESPSQRNLVHQYSLISHRPLVKLAIAGSESAELTPFEYVLLNLHYPGFGSTPQVVISLLERLKKMPEFQLTYQRDDVFLFRKKP